MTPSIRSPRARKALLPSAAVLAMVAGLTIGSTTSATALPAGCAVPGTFGRMFAGLPKADWPNQTINNLSNAVMSSEELEPTPENEVDAEENTTLDAGYTYVGQLLDHDLTLEGNDNDLLTPLEPTSVTNQRTPALDLDSIYGGGPTARPELYAADRIHLKTGRPLTGAAPSAADLPRAANGRALAGDPRDDENRVVGGLHTLMIRFHNKLADRVSLLNPLASSSRKLELTQSLVRKYWQYAVLTDFLPRVAGRSTVNAVLPAGRLTSLTGPTLKFYNPCTEGMPVEFSVGAYRYGHSQVRALYRINAGQPARVPVFTPNFTDATSNLAGFSPAPSNYGIDWSYFFDIRNKREVGRPQTSYKFDNSLVYPLALLPLPATGTGPSTLATRNLLRSEQMGLPSGQDVARAMGIAPLPDDRILIGKATGDTDEAKGILAVDPAFAGKAPLWTYVLAEATAQSYPVAGGRITGPQKAPFTLGPVGGRIVTEVVVGLTWADRNSVLHDPLFLVDPSISGNLTGRFGFPELIKFATA